MILVRLYLDHVCVVGVKIFDRVYKVLMLDASALESNPCEGVVDAPSSMDTLIHEDRAEVGLDASYEDEVGGIAHHVMDVKKLKKEHDV
mmetsp:Transcript_884/g.1080  ORF Transcript_884/g.1080 Transcript_884/m.1080 type:complete len:89 (+) Transcript_884:659-925(+)